MDPMKPNRPADDIPISAEIQAFVYRNVLRNIRDLGCGYDEAWDIFKKEVAEKITMRIDNMKEADRHQQHSDQSKMDRNRNRNRRVGGHYGPQRAVPQTDTQKE